MITHLTAGPDCKLESQLGNISFVEIDHEINSVVSLPLPLIQEGQLPVTGTKY